MEKRTKTNEKKKMAGSLSNGPFLTSLFTEAQKSKFHKRKSSFHNWNFSTIFCGFWRLLERLKKNKNTGTEDDKKGTREKKRKTTKTSKIEKKERKIEKLKK